MLSVPVPVLLLTWLAACAQVDAKHLPCLANWSAAHSLETVLVELRREMTAPANKKLPQPAEGTVFPH